MLQFMNIFDNFYFTSHPYTKSIKYTVFIIHFTEVHTMVSIVIVPSYIIYLPTIVVKSVFRQYIMGN